MPVRQYANAPATTLANSCTSLATSIVVVSVTGLPISYPYTLILERGTASEEAVSVTAAAGTTLTVTRGIDGTTAFAHSANASVVHGITAQDIREANAHVNASSGVHGATGSVVGTTDAQTITNKTIGATNVINGFTASRFMEADGTGRLVSGTKATPVGAVVGTTDAQTLSNKTLGITNNFPWIIQRGSGTVVWAGATQNQSLAVTFGAAFASAPSVVASVDDERFWFAVKSVTTTGFTITGSFNGGAAAAGFNLNFKWIAVL